MTAPVRLRSQRVSCQVGAEIDGGSDETRATTPFLGRGRVVIGKRRALGNDVALARLDRARLPGRSGRGQRPGRSAYLRFISSHDPDLRRVLPIGVATHRRREPLRRGRLAACAAETTRALEEI